MAYSAADCCSPAVDLRACVPTELCYYTILCVLFVDTHYRCKTGGKFISSIKERWAIIPLVEVQYLPDHLYKVYTPGKTKRIKRRFSNTDIIIFCPIGVHG